MTASFDYHGAYGRSFRFHLSRWVQALPRFFIFSYVLHARGVALLDCMIERAILRGFYMGGMSLAFRAAFEMRSNYTGFKFLSSLF